MGTKPSAAVAIHLHKDLDVNPERVRAFGRDSYETQLSVLTELRSRSVDDSTSMEFAVAGLLLAFITFVVAPTKVFSLDGLPWWTSVIVWGVLLLTFTVAMFPILIPQAIRSGQKERAAVWLLSYEDEISRRRSVDSKAGRAWRKSH